MEKVITIAVAGYGLRGQCYSQYTLEHPDTMKVVAVADIVREKVDAAKQLFNLPEQMCFDSAEQMLEQPKLADLMFICTQDRQHVPMALAALEKGYHVLLEKPISPELSECIELQKKAHEKNRVVTVCHVLRYSRSTRPSSRLWTAASWEKSATSLPMRTSVTFIRRTALSAVTGEILRKPAQ